MLYHLQVCTAIMPPLFRLVMNPKASSAIGKTKAENRYSSSSTLFYTSWSSTLVFEFKCACRYSVVTSYCSGQEGTALAITLSASPRSLFWGLELESGSPFAQARMHAHKTNGVNVIIKIWAGRECTAPHHMTSAMLTFWAWRHPLLRHHFKLKSPAILVHKSFSPRSMKGQSDYPADHEI